MTTEKMIIEIKEWLKEAAGYIKVSFTNEIEISQKSNRKDLVTNIDEETQTFFINKINEHYPGDRILAEEKGFNTIDSLTGRVWIIDPIDGTMNFVMEQENFCIMIAVFEEGVGQLGFIYDVMKDELYWGGKNLGVFLNDQKLKAPKNLSLSEGLLGMNAYMYGENLYSAKEIGHVSMGVRVSGCAGIELIAMLKGNHIGYVSNLSPWDYAAGLVLIEEFGFKYSNIDGSPLGFAKREYFLAATAKAYEEIQKTYILESE
ncbi:myo-inositol-1(or 4)-monophosphatase [Enterococcus sp. DIV0212c]|uniref:inositol monophosphatase family protein n=1 Tax=Enterococcus sp. DIV0212c TaxID=2230867 RepID=UPI001A9BFB64|nr:inositol monophosphatase family protein [Enterococcus sp. DIV0212c]MBO1354927.1 inositol monophosphatase family protein [Enterococcus sp. DIV0212c]